MIMEIRVVIDVPDEDKDKQQDVIEGIIEVVKVKLPNLRTVRRYSPINVTIRGLDEVIP